MRKGNSSRVSHSGSFLSPLLWVWIFISLQNISSSSSFLHPSYLLFLSSFRIPRIWFGVLEWFASNNRSSNLALSLKALSSSHSKTWKNGTAGTRIFFILENGNVGHAHKTHSRPISLSVSSLDVSWCMPAGISLLFSSPPPPLPENLSSISRASQSSPKKVSQPPSIKISRNTPPLHSDHHAQNSIIPPHPSIIMLAHVGMAALASRGIF